MSYIEFFNSKCDINGESYKQVGYSSLKNAIIRYRNFIPHLQKIKDIFNLKDLSLFELGPGNGLFYSYVNSFKDKYDILNNISSLTAVDIMDTLKDKFLNESKNLIKNVNYICCDFRDYKEDIIFDISFSIGALDYYNLNELSEILDKLNKISKYGFVFEINYKTVHTVDSPGTQHYEFNDIYKILYDKYIKEFTKTVEFNFIKKNTVIISVYNNINIGD